MTTRDRVYHFICQFWLDNYYGPTNREIAAGVGLRAHSTANMHVKNLIAEGRIKENGGRRRSARPASMEITIHE